MNQISSSSVAELSKNVEDIETDPAKVAEHQEYAEALSMSERNGKRRWNQTFLQTRNVLSVVAILIALLLIIGAIYMHLRQKHHLGRLHLNRKDPGGEDVLEADFPLVTVPGVAAQTITTFRPPSSPPPSPLEPSAECLACMAITATNNIPAPCKFNGRVVQCGIYRISHDYWMDTQLVIDPYDSLAHDYEGCVAVQDCAEKIVRGYVSRYGKDCDADGRIGCRDHIMLHMRGPSGCQKQEPLPIWSKTRMEDCLKYRGLP